MYYYSYNSAPDETPPSPWLPEPPQAPPKKRRHSERAAVAVLLSLVLLVGGTAGICVVAARNAANELWSTTVFYSQPEPAPEPTPKTTLKRAPVGDGTTLTLALPPETDPLSLQEIYRRVSPSIVSVTSTYEGGRGEGTGVVMSADGYLITNAHVIDGSSRVDVTLEDGRRYEALLVGSDEATDLAVLKIEVRGLTPAIFGNSDYMTVGDSVVAIGNPMGEELRGTMTDGILSAINRDMAMGSGRMALLQTTAALNSGNSGGALVNDRAQVVGITNMKLVTSGFEAPIEGLGFAIPTAAAKPIVDALLAEGHVTGRPVLGVVVRPAYPQELAPYRVEGGLFVERVEQGSDARASGLREGDILLIANGVTLKENQDLMDVRDPLGVGGILRVTVGREGRLLDLKFRLVEQYMIEAR